MSDVNIHRVMKWIEGAKEGIVVAGDQGDENGVAQFYYHRANKKPLSYTIKVVQRK